MTLNKSLINNISNKNISNTLHQFNKDYDKIRLDQKKILEKLKKKYIRDVNNINRKFEKEINRRIDKVKDIINSREDYSTYKSYDGNKIDLDDSDGVKSMININTTSKSLYNNSIVPVQRSCLDDL